jgi:hypothetical protein
MYLLVIFNPSTLGASTVNYMFFRNGKKIAPNFNLFFKEQFYFILCVKGIKEYFENILVHSIF